MQRFCARFAHAALTFEDHRRHRGRAPWSHCPGVSKCVGRQLPVTVPMPSTTSVAGRCDHMGRAKSVFEVAAKLCSRQG